MKTKTFANVWDALSDSPEEAATMKIRSDVMIAIHDTISAWDTTQAQAANRLGVTQPRPQRPVAGQDQQVLSRYPADAGGTRRSQVKINIGRAA